MTLSICKKRELEDRGMVLVPAEPGSLHRQILEVGSCLGAIKEGRSGSLIQELRPVNSSEAHQNSLSAKFSDGAFPLHVDTAHWIVPARYLIFGCAHEGSRERKTLLVDSKDMELLPREIDLLNQCPFQVKNGKKSFFSNVLSPGRPFIRYDPGCMKPMWNCKDQIESIFSAIRWRRKTREITWEKDRLLVVDNWRFLHGRSDALDGCEGRLLLRAVVQ